MFDIYQSCWNAAQALATRSTCMRLDAQTRENAWNSLNEQLVQNFPTVTRNDITKCASNVRRQLLHPETLSDLVCVRVHAVSLVDNQSCLMHPQGNGTH